MKAIRSVLNTTELQQPSSVLLLNLGLHYPVSVNFTTFQKVVGQVINLLKETQVDLQGKAFQCITFKPWTSLSCQRQFYNFPEGRRTSNKFVERDTS